MSVQFDQDSNQLTVGGCGCDMPVGGSSYNAHQGHPQQHTRRRPHQMKFNAPGGAHSPQMMMPTPTQMPMMITARSFLLLAARALLVVVGSAGGNARGPVLLAILLPIWIWMTVVTVVVQLCLARLLIRYWRLQQLHHRPHRPHRWHPHQHHWEAMQLR